MRKNLFFNIGRLTFISLVVARCASDAPTLQNGVALSNQSAQFQNCEELSEVHFVPQSKTPNGWRDELRESVKAVGGNSAYVEPPASPTSPVSARAYQCPTEAERTASASRNSARAELAQNRP
jgi:hypothetical protein